MEGVGVVSVPKDATGKNRAYISEKLDLLSHNTLKSSVLTNEQQKAIPAGI